MDNIERDPFEHGDRGDPRPCLVLAVRLAGPVTAYVYDWNLLPIGQVLWLKELRVVSRVPAAAKSRVLQPESDLRSDQGCQGDGPCQRIGRKGSQELRERGGPNIFLRSLFIGEEIAKAS